MPCEETLCWSCRNFAGGCSWSREFKPVDGWRARKIKRLYNVNLKGNHGSFIVFECPQYIADD